MENILIQFIVSLRNAEISISPAETIDALNAVALVGYDNRQRLRDTLATVLAKSEDDNRRFIDCFNAFFRLDPFQWNDQPDSNVDEESSSELNGSDESALGSASVEAFADDSNLEALANDLDDTAQAVLQALQADDQVALALQIQQSAQDNNLQSIMYTTQRSLFRYRILQSMGVDTIEQNARRLQMGTNASSAMVDELRQAIIRLREQVGDYVDHQLLLTANAAGQQLREDILQNANLSRIEQRHFETMQTLVHRMSKALVARYARRRKIQRRGQLAIAKTIRHNISNQGVLFDTFWKTRKKERPDIFVLCDVSGSVSAYSKFLLLFLYSLSDVLPKTRAFAFSSNLGEVSDLFREFPVAEAIEKVNRQWWFGSSSYGDSLRDFAALAMNDLRSNSTVIILGDGRNNGGDPELAILREIYQRSGRVIWLNPESRAFWSVGDSEMPKYLSCVHYANSCQTLRQLEAVISDLLRNS